MLFPEILVELNGYSSSSSQAVTADHAQPSLQWTSVAGYLVS